MEDGVWRTVGGRRIFIKNGEDLATAMKRSGKFKKKKDEEEETEYEKYVKSKLNDEDYIRKNNPNLHLQKMVEQSQEKRGKEYRDKLKSIKGKEDGTYNLDTGEKVDFGNEGYNVSFEQSSDNFTDAQYYGKIRECSELCDGKVYGGVFGGDPEISFYTKDKNVAIKIMKKYNQHSIWDNSIGDIIENPDYIESKNKTNYKKEG